MSTRQLGKIGLVLLGVYLVVSSLSSVILNLGRMAIPGSGVSAGEFAAFLMLNLVLIVIFAVLPAAWIILRRDRLANAWFVEDRHSQTSVEPQTLLAVGLVLIGVSTLIAGLVRLPLAAGQYFAQGAMAAAGTSLQAGVHLALGVGLIRGSKSLAAKLS